MAGQLEPAATGRVAGKLLAETLVNLLDGAPLMFGSLVGAQRNRATGEFGLTFFPEGMTDRSDAWLRNDALNDAVLVQYPAGKRDDQLRVMLPVCDGTDRMAVLVAYKVVARVGRVATSLPGYQLFNGTAQHVYDELISGVTAGIESHKRKAELAAGWGTLGAFKP